MPAKTDVFISIDIEADGPAPTTNSCLELGFVVGLYHAKPIRGDRSWILETRDWCLHPQPGRVEDARCMNEFWSKNQDVLKRIRENAVDASVAMREFSEWYKELCDRYNVIGWVARPASYDMMWITCLFNEFGPADRGTIPFSIRCLSTAMWVADKWMKIKIDYDQLRDPDLPHTHNACDDAMEQGYMFLALRECVINYRETDAVQNDVINNNLVLKFENSEKVLVGEGRSKRLDDKSDLVACLNAIQQRISNKYLVDKSRPWHVELVKGRSDEEALLTAAAKWEGSVIDLANAASWQMIGSHAFVLILQGNIHITVAYCTNNVTIADFGWMCQQVGEVLAVPR